MDSAITLSELESEIEDELKICCGATTEAIDLVRKFLSILRQRRIIADADPKNPAWDKTFEAQDELLGIKTNVGLYYTFLYRMDELDLSEHGGGCRACWITQHGEAVLDKLEAWAKAKGLA